MIDVSVIVCTYNRAESLRDTIESLVRQKTQACSYEIIVVDNNSKDHTENIAKSFNGKVKYIFEAKQGLSYARNTGIREAKGQIIAFTDDDVIADSNWILSMYQCFKETKAFAVGGKIERLWNCDRPEWLSDELMGPLIVQDLGFIRKRWDQKNRHMIGANMAFHRSIFEKKGGFKEELGRKGDALTGGEDREIFRRMFEGNVPIFYEPNAIIHHKVEPERLTKEYIRHWFLDVGKTLGHQISWKWHYLITLGPFWVWKNLWKSLFRFVRSNFEPGVKEAEKFASEVWLKHYSAMMLERIFHWFPLNLGNRFCVFEKNKIKGE